MLDALRRFLPKTRAEHESSLLTALSDPRVYGMMRWRSFLQHCFVPGVFYDVGANDPYSREGQQTVYKPLMPTTKFYLFEAMAKHEPSLGRSGEPYTLGVLDSADGVEKVFYESSAYAPGTGDSLYLERTDAYAADAVIATRHVTRRIDGLVDELKWPLPDFIKLDTQGSELDILRGGPNVLAHARGLQIECNLQRYNEGAPMLSEIVAFAEAAGFRIYDIAQFHFNKKQELLQADVIFVRNDLVTDGW
jgi:FkbM family methyltransferase